MTASNTAKKVKPLKQEDNNELMDFYKELDERCDVVLERITKKNKKKANANR